MTDIWLSLYNLSLFQQSQESVLLYVLLHSEYILHVYLPLIKALFSEVNPIPVKRALNLMGFEVGGLRSPLTEMESEHTIVLKQELEKVGLLS